MLCMIQRDLGSEALSDICALYHAPDQSVWSAARSMDWWCPVPEAARVVLLHRPHHAGHGEADPAFAKRDTITYNISSAN